LTAVSSSITKLLTVLRDAIKAHRSLYLKGDILHRDISENNVIVTDPDETGGFTGVLIDLDLAKVVGSERSEAHHPTGTVQFMAIEVLRGLDHTYRHDLESFFYVLIWLCARRGWGFCGNARGQPTNSRLSCWYTGTFEDIAHGKLGDMIKARDQGFALILREFPPAFACVKPLCASLRDILFPYEEEEGLFTGTRKNPDDLYGPILEAFDKAIAVSKGN
jgi:serine/threonine protein kinase